MSRLLEEFKEYLKEMNQYDHVTGLLQWDMQTTVPKLGQAAHVDALTYFSMPHKPPCRSRPCCSCL